MSQTFRLFAMPGVLTGMARTLDLGGTLSDHSYEVSETPVEADTAAIWGDWLMVGEDIWATLESIGGESHVGSQ